MTPGRLTRSISSRREALVLGTFDRHGAVVDTGLLFEHPSSHEHDPSLLLAEHPDKPGRMAAIDLALAAHGGLDGLGWERRLAPAATRAELEGVHDPALLGAHQRCRKPLGIDRKSTRPN